MSINSYWQLRPKSHKSYVSINNMLAWGLAQDNSPIYINAYTRARHLFSEAIKLFNGTYTYETPDGETHYYPNLGITEIDLLNYYFEEYGDRLVARPFEPGRVGIVSLDDNQFAYRTLSPNAAMDVCLDITYRKTQQFVKFNTYKYLTLVRTTGFNYDPIENYRMVENGEDKRTPNLTSTNTKTGSYDVDKLGSEDTSHNVQLNKLSHYKVTAPVDSIAGSVTDGNLEVALAINATKETRHSSGESSSSRAGSGIGSASGGINGSGSSASVGNGNDFPTSKNYTTTFDDASQSRLSDYNETQGSSGSAKVFAESSSEEVIAMAEIDAGNPNAYSYTQSNSFTGRKDTTTYNSVRDQKVESGTETVSHSSTRSGNIGVTTTQQMIESERELANLNIIRQFCEELNKEILLEVYDSGVPTEILVEMFNSAP